jgi:hypothetical protein
MPVATCLPHLECLFRTVHLDVLAVSVRLLPGTRPRQGHSLSWVGVPVQSRHLLSGHPAGVADAAQVFLHEVILLEKCW